MTDNHHPRLDPGVDIGHVHLKVAQLDRAIAFYRDVLGFTVQGRLGDTAAFLSADGYHHHIGLNTFESRGGAAPAAGTTGLYHAAIRYPTRAALARALRRLYAHGVELTGASDHGASEALYLNDPDGNGLELTWDRPAHEWPRTADGQLALINLPLDLDSLLELAPANDARHGAPQR
jgi:catechol 2,3-dioxygenase